VQLLAQQASGLPWTKSISARFGLDRANDALAAVELRSVVKALIVPNH
jgi:hypothetical protein